MTIYSCEPNWKAMLSCIYDAWSSRLGVKNVQLVLEPIEQYSLFDTYVHVDSDEVKACKLMDAINLKISPRVYSELSYLSMAYEPDVLDTIFHVLVLGFTYGEHILEMVNYRDVMRYKEIRKRLSTEVMHFEEFLRFHSIADRAYIAHIEPKSRLIPALGHIFEDRMPSEHWMIIDDVHREALIHPKDEHFYIRQLGEEEFNRLLLTEKENDEYTDLWKAFFNSIAIKERENYVCQRNLYPKWTRKHAVEFS